MVSKGETVHINELSSVIAWQQGDRVGAATYRLTHGGCELVSINALEGSRGTGTALLQAVEAKAAAAGCSRLWLITTNDNLTALGFYQKRGYRLCALYPGAVDIARKTKLTIPLVSDDGIPIRDELELEKLLGVESTNS